MCLTVCIALYPGSSPAEEEPGYKATSLIPRLSPCSNEKSWCLFQMCSTNRYRDDGMVEAHFAFSHCTFSLSHFILPPLSLFAFSHFAFSLCLLNKEVQLQLVIYRSCHHKSFLLLPSFSPHSPDFPETGTSV